MPVWIRNCLKFLIAACLIVSFCLVEGDAQTRRKKKRRRSVPAAPKPVITNPTIAPPDGTTPDDVKIISTADSKESGEQLQGSKTKVTSPEPTEGEKTQQTISDLSKQVDRLNNKLTQMQEDDRYQLDMERLTRAEQRAEQLRSQLMDVQAKIADFEAKLEQIRCSKSDFMKPAALVRCCSALVKFSAASYARSNGWFVSNPNPSKCTPG